MTVDERNVWGMGIVMFGYPAIIVITLVLLVVAAKMSGRRGSWTGPPRMLLLGWLGLLTFDIPLKLASLAIHCAVWTGFHVEPGLRLSSTYSLDWCGIECAEALSSDKQARWVVSAREVARGDSEGRPREVAFWISEQSDWRCRSDWQSVLSSLPKSERKAHLDHDLCLDYGRTEATAKPAVYVFADEVDHTNPGSIFWFTFKRGFEVWDIEADRMVAWFRGYDIRLSWLFPLELGCPADRDLMKTDVAVLENGRLMRP